MPVKAIALDRVATGFSDSVFERCHALLLRSSCTRHVENSFLQNRLMQIIHAVTERDLGQWQAQTDPISSQMVDVIQIKPTHGEIAKLLKRGGRLYVRQHRRLRLESKWNKTCKAASLILQFAQLTQ